MNLILGIDVGTLKSKALLLDESYAILDRLTRENEGERGEGVRILIEKKARPVKSLGGPNSRLF